ncbi:MAG: hypothetical protein JJ975_11265 [Bacteroidia bacterium]|nr:hypothetical protein [Bacteroidia bacterium]
MNRNVVNLLIGLVCCLVFVGTSAAQTINSPYTFGSLGLLQSQTFVHQQFMGGLSSGLHSKGDFSFVNPASLHALEQTSLQTGSELQLIEQLSGDNTNQDFTGNFGYFAMGIPLSLKRKIAFGAGLSRLSEVDYFIPGEATENGIPVVNVFTGDGGINQFKTGIGGEIFKGFSLGVGANFMFGNIKEQLDKQFQENNEIFSLQNTNTTYYNGVKWNFGVQYTRQIRENSYVTLAGHLSPSSELTTSRDDIMRTYNFDGNFFIDTISSRTDTKSTQGLPMEYGGGLTIGADNRWLVGVEYNVAKWSEVEKLRNANPFFDQTSFTIGGYLQLKEAMNNQHTSFVETLNDYLKTTRIYYGFRMQSLYSGVVNEQINETAVSLGFGLPLTRVYAIEGVKYRMVSRINIGAEYIMRGKRTDGQVQENILGIKLGLTFNDKWFNKRKYQ